MPHWESIQGLAIGLPLGHVLLQQGLESRVVGGLDDVKQLVDEDVLHTLVASGILRLMYGFPSVTTDRVPWLSGLHRTQKPDEMDHIWTKLIHVHTNEVRSGNLDRGGRPL